MPDLATIEVIANVSLTATLVGVTLYYARQARRQADAAEKRQRAVERERLSSYVESLFDLRISLRSFQDDDRLEPEFVEKKIREGLHSSPYAADHISVLRRRALGVSDELSRVCLELTAVADKVSDLFPEPVSADFPEDADTREHIAERYATGVNRVRKLADYALKLVDEELTNRKREIVSEPVRLTS